MSYSHYFPSISHTFHWNFINKYITFCKVICICCQSAMTELEYMKSPFTYTQYVVENNNCSSNTFCQCCVPKISPKQYSVPHNLLKNRPYLTLYVKCTADSVVPASLPTNTGATVSPSDLPVRHTILTDTSYCISSHGVSPMLIFPLTSSSFKPKLLPSIVTSVPPSIGPLSGLIWKQVPL